MHRSIVFVLFLFVLATSSLARAQMPSPWSEEAVAQPPAAPTASLPPDSERALVLSEIASIEDELRPDSELTLGVAFGGLAAGVVATVVPLVVATFTALWCVGGTDCLASDLHGYLDPVGWIIGALAGAAMVGGFVAHGVVRAEHGEERRRVRDLRERLRELDRRSIALRINARGLELVF